MLSSLPLSSFMKSLQVVTTILRNKYLLAIIAFAVWMLFFDRNDFFAQMDRKKELKELQESKAFFTEEIKKERKFSEDLKHNPTAIEKFAREEYKMKRDNEDLFLIQPANKEEN